MELSFRGAGPSGGGAKFTTRPDTLRSNDTFEGLLGLCVGPIKGPVDGMKTIRVNQTPIEDDNGDENFKDFQCLFADGDPLKFPQKVTLRLGAAGAPTNIGIQLTNLGGSNSTWVTRTVNEVNAHAVDLRFNVSQLYREDKHGIYETTANIEIQMKPVGTATWINPFNANGNTMPPTYSPSGYPVENESGSFVQQIMSSQNFARLSGGDYGSYLTINGKTNSTEIKELRVSLPYTGVYADKGWDIRCRLVETDSLDADPNFEKRTISWESVTAVFTDTLGDREEWRGLAWLQLYGKASDSFNGIPDLDGVYDTKIVSVPPSAVYNPDTRQYTGAIWDGSWAKSYTNDPAWVINDAISDSLSGLARLMPGAHLNKWDALELSKYCSELVSDGAGGQQPRFSLNLVVTEAQRSDDFIRYLAGACGATAWDNGDGEWRTAVDKPQVPVALYTHENTEGEFVYSHTDIDTRFNEVTIVFNNEDFDFREDRVKVEDPDHIAKFGRKPTKVVAIGCTNRQQAVRWAILKLRTNINEFRNVTLTTNRQGKMLERFNWILVADGSLNQTIDDTKRTTGRVVQNKGGSIVLRDTVRIEVGVAYQIQVTAPNPNYNPDTTTAPTDPSWQLPTVTFTRNVTNTNAARGDVTEIFLDAPLPAGVAENANIALSAPGLPSIPKVFRVVDLDWNDDGERVTINAIEVDTGKYPASDTANYDYTVPGYAKPGSIIPPPVAPPSGVIMIVPTVMTAIANNRALRATWRRPAYPLVKGYRVEHRFDYGPWENLGFTTQLQSEIMNPLDGFHEYRIYTVDYQGRESLPLTDNASVGVLPEWAPVGLLTNESHTVAAAADGSGFDLSQAGGQFIMYSPGGQIVDDLAFSVNASDGATATIDANGVYAITELTADTATVTFRSTWFGYTVDKVYTISKSKAGVAGTAGANAKLLYLISDRQTIAFDGAGNLSPAAQTITFTVQKLNTTAAVNWAVTDINGVAQDAAATLSQVAGTWEPQVTMSAAQFNTARNGTNGVIVTAYLTDGTVLSDKISVVKVASGAAGTPGTNGTDGTDGPPGPAGPTVGLTADIGAFDFIDGVAVNSGQLATLTAVLQNSTETIDWTASPGVTLGTTANPLQRTLSIANFGFNNSVTITATGHTSGAKASITLVRNAMTTPSDSIIPDSAWSASDLITSTTWTRTTGGFVRSQKL